MTRIKHVTKQPVVLDGFQAVMKPSKHGHTLSCIVDDDLIQALEADREEALKWAESKLKNPKRKTLKPEPWEEVADGKYKLKFSWGDAGSKKPAPVVVDTVGTPITDPNLPLYSGSTVKLQFHQKPYVMMDGYSYGTSLVLTHVMVVSLNSKAGVDYGPTEDEDVMSLFGETKGFKVDEPNVMPPPEEEEDDDIPF